MGRTRPIWTPTPLKRPAQPPFNRLRNSPGVPAEATDGLARQQILATALLAGATGTGLGLQQHTELFPLLRIKDRLPKGGVLTSEMGSHSLEAWAEQDALEGERFPQIAGCGSDALLVQRMNHRADGASM